MAWIHDKQLRGYIGSWAYILLVFSIIGFLSFQEVPVTNKDLISTIIGMLVASLTIVIYTLLGKDEDEVKSLKANNEVLQSQNDDLKKRIVDLEGMFRDLQAKVIDKLSIISEE